MILYNIPNSLPKSQVALLDWGNFDHLKFPDPSAFQTNRNTLIYIESTVYTIITYQTSSSQSPNPKASPPGSRLSPPRCVPSAGHRSSPRWNRKLSRGKSTKILWNLLFLVGKTWYLNPVLVWYLILNMYLLQMVCTQWRSGVYKSGLIGYCCFCKRVEVLVQLQIPS